MSKVLVDQEWLKRLHRDLDACQKVIWLGLRGADPAYCQDAQDRLKEIDELLAQPAEAEGVERWSELRALAESAPGENWKAGNAYGKPFIPTYQVIADTVDGPCVILEGNKNFIEQAKAAVTFAAAANPAAVLELIAALSSVTAERDRLRKAPAGWAKMDPAFVVEHIRETTVFDADMIEAMLEFAIGAAMAAKEVKS